MLVIARQSYLLPSLESCEIEITQFDLLFSAIYMISYQL